MKIETIENVPEWANCYLMYGDESGLTAPDKREIDNFLDCAVTDSGLSRPSKERTTNVARIRLSDWLAPPRTGRQRT